MIKIKQTVNILELKLRKHIVLCGEGKQKKINDKKVTKNQKDQTNKQAKKQKSKQAKPNTKIRNEKIDRSTGRKERRHRKEQKTQKTTITK